jgi:DNA primase
MIPKETIDRIIDAARVEEVVGDFVNLRRRGANMIGLCPFHDEKTPSFNVSPTKGIFKCFGCGKAGDSVTFVMEHEHLSFTEAIKFIGKKYGIEVEDKVLTSEEAAVELQREALYSVLQFAQQYYSDLMLTSDEGRSVGLGYFTDRGFDETTIKRFQLGYSSSARDAFVLHATSHGYKTDILEKAGLIAQSQGRHYDRFFGRVIFPILGLSGRVIAFAGRILVKSDTQAKYVNSPETEIYHKSSVLYGLFQARKGISTADNCYLVEGYTDVISLSQAGIENVVASSGTSLTVEQIRLIRRYTTNITILYDGDEAGIKASFRGIDMILEEGMNVKVLLFPGGDDPDSFVRKHRPKEVKTYITERAVDFIKFRTGLLLKEAKGDPIKLTALAKELLHSISLIPDPISRTYFIRQCSAEMGIDERTLTGQLAKILFARKKKQMQSNDLPEPLIPIAEEGLPERLTSIDKREHELIACLINYGSSTFTFTEAVNKYETVEHIISAAHYIINELGDAVHFEHPSHRSIYKEFADYAGRGETPSEQYLINHPDAEVRNMVIDVMAISYTISENWKKRKITVKDPSQKLYLYVRSVILSYKLKIVMGQLREIDEKLKTTIDIDEATLLVQIKMELGNTKNQISGELSRVIL